MFIKRKGERKKKSISEPQFPVEKGCWILNCLNRLSWRGGATCWVHDARLVRLTAALPLSPPASNLYILPLALTRPPQDRTLPRAPVYRREVRCFLYVCVEKLSIPRLGHSLTGSWKPAVWQAGHWKPRNGPGSEIYVPSNWSKMAAQITD